MSCIEFSSFFKELLWVCFVFWLLLFFVPWCLVLVTLHALVSIINIIGLKTILGNSYWIFNIIFIIGPKEILVAENLTQGHHIDRCVAYL